jgi:ribosomal protein L16 Arg81 hydroxylase
MVHDYLQPGISHVSQTDQASQRPSAEELQRRGREAWAAMRAQMKPETLDSEEIQRRARENWAQMRESQRSAPSESANQKDLEKWRDELRRAREQANNESRQREHGRDRTRDNDRDGPEYER